ncbi:MAG: hypothetical protein R2708_09960 [Vicinamibacterales bacterium]
MAAGLDARRCCRGRRTRRPEWRPFVDISGPPCSSPGVRCCAGDLLVAQGVIDRALVPVEVKAVDPAERDGRASDRAGRKPHLELRSNLFGPVGGTILQVVLPPGLPPGAWQVELSLIDPVSGAVLSRGSAPFEVLP